MKFEIWLFDKDRRKVNTSYHRRMIPDSYSTDVAHHGYTFNFYQYTSAATGYVKYIQMHCIYEFNPARPIEIKFLVLN